MKLLKILFACFFLGAAAQGAAQADPQLSTTRAAPTRMVMTWVPAYAISASRLRLTASYGTGSPRSALTHLALQFWTPKPDGGLKRVLPPGGQPITNTRIEPFVTWAHANGIKVMLCVFNGETTWDWPLAKNAFATHRDTFITALIGQMELLGLDGIDVDFEGVDTSNPSLEADKPAYISFVKELARRVHLKGKQVTVDSFPYIWNAPNQNWWTALFPLVDGLTSMGYAEIGRNAADWAAYSAQKAAATYPRKLMLGVPSDVADWQGDTAINQINWFTSPQAGKVGVAIWDAQLLSPAWRKQSIWNHLKVVRNYTGP